MTFTPQIQVFSGAQVTTAGYTGVDWANNRVWRSDAGKITRVDLPSGLQTAYAPLSDYAGGIPFLLGPYAVGVCGDGDVYLSAKATNWGYLIRIHGDTMGEASPNPRIAYHGSIADSYGGDGMAVIQPGGSQFTIDWGNLRQVVTQDDTVIPYLQRKTWTSGYSVAGSRWYLGSNVGWWMESLTPGGADLYKVFFDPGGGFVLQHSFVPHDIDSTADYLFIGGMCIDETDHHIIVYGTCGADTFDAFIAKINSSTFAVEWVCPLASGPTGIVPHHWNQSVINNQTLYVLLNGTPATLVTIDTSDGSSTSTTTGYAGIGPFSDGQISNDDLDCVITKTPYTQGANSPEPLNSTPSTFTTRWVALYVGDGEVVTPPPVGAGTGDVWFHVSRAQRRART